MRQWSVAIGSLALPLSLALAEPPKSLPENEQPDAEPATDAKQLPPGSIEATAVDVGMYVISSYRYGSRGEQSRSEFALERGEAWIEGKYGPHLTANLRIESFRSAGDFSQVGVDGNSLVFRVNRAYVAGQIEPWDNVALSLKAGVLRNPWIRAAERGYGLVPLSRTAGESSGFHRVSALGAMVGARAFKQRLAVNFMVANGEGANQLEQNDHKEIALVISGVPLTFQIGSEMVRVRAFAGLQIGAVGVAAAANDRYGFGLTIDHPLFAIGGEYIYANGIDSQTLTGDSFAAFGRGIVVPGWLGVAGRWQRNNQNRSASDAVSSTVTLGLFVDPFSKSQYLQSGRLYLAYQRQDYGDDALPYLDSRVLHRALVIFAFAPQGELK